jgi:ribosomal protein S18 acetylase RimI-like enzyme
MLHQNITTTVSGIGAINTMPAMFLNDSSKPEVLDFLETRPAQTAMLSGLIRDNGLRSDFNRGDFFGCRNEHGELEGVALIGHATLFETRSERALYSLASRAQNCPGTHMLMGEQDGVQMFWEFYAGRQATMRKSCREHLLELRPPVELREEVPGLRVATPEDLEAILPIHAQMAFEESGVNPLDTDPEGFRQRYLRRIEKQRSWVKVDSGKVVFKAEIVSQTPHVAYLEGVWVNPENRSQGEGTNCVLQLSKHLLSRSESVCLFVNEENIAALSFYERMGFKDKDSFDTIFLRPF